MPQFNKQPLRGPFVTSCDFQHVFDFFLFLGVRSSAPQICDSVFFTLRCFKTCFLHHASTLHLRDFGASKRKGDASTLMANRCTYHVHLGELTFHRSSRGWLTSRKVCEKVQLKSLEQKFLDALEVRWFTFNMLYLLKFPWVSARENSCTTSPWFWMTKSSHSLENCPLLTLKLRSDIIFLCMFAFVTGRCRWPSRLCSRCDFSQGRLCEQQSCLRGL